jgi:hypothetical protein
MIILNLWSDGGLWTGDIRIGDSIYLGIEYIELIYNRSSDALTGPYVSLSQDHGGHQRAPLTDGSLGNGNPLEPDMKQKHESASQVGRAASAEERSGGTGLFVNLVRDRATLM